MNHPLDPFIDRYIKGEKLVPLSQEANVPYMQLIRRMKERFPGKTITELRTELRDPKVVELWEHTYMSIEHLAQMFGVTDSTIREILQRAGYRSFRCKICEGPVPLMKDRNHFCSDGCYSQKGRHKHLKTMYNMSVMEYDTMYRRQKGACKICGKKGELVVDHDHKTGEVRGLLCQKCNVGLGIFDDDIGLMKKAIRYLSP